MDLAFLDQFHTMFYGTQTFVLELRQEIVTHVISKWNEFSTLTHDKFGNNYASSDEYLSDMSLSSTFGSYCELVAAAELYSILFEVYCNGELYARTGAEGNPLKRIRFTGELSGGHFDVYTESESAENISNSSTTKKKFSQTPC